MATEPHIDLPVLPDDKVSHRSIVENHVKGIVDGVAQDNILVRKYYKTANEQIYEDCLNLIQSGVPAYLVRTRREETDEANPAEKMDEKTCSIEIISAAPVGIEKGIRDVNRYVYVMHELVREELRKASNRLSVGKSKRKPFIYLGNRDIYRDDDIDILLSEYNIEYIVF